MTTGTTTARPPVTTDQHQRELGLDIYRLLKSNASNARPVYDLAGSTMPDGDTNALIRSRSVDAVRAEIFGITITIEVTTNQDSEQDDPDSLRYKANCIIDFRDWFAALLQLFGVSMMPSATVTVLEFAIFMANTVRNTPPDPRPAPTFHRKNEGR